MTVRHEHLGMQLEVLLGFWDLPREEFGQHLTRWPKLRENVAVVLP